MSIGREKLGFYLYKRRDHETKAPYHSVGDARKTKVKLGKLLKNSIISNLVLAPD